MWDILLKIGTIALVLIVFLIVVYIASGIQAKAWLDVFEKFFYDKFNKN